MDNCRGRWPTPSARDWKSLNGCDLVASVEENRRIRERRAGVFLEGLPCGVLVIDEAEVRISAWNPETARLLCGNFESADALPTALRMALDQAREDGPGIPIAALRARTLVLRRSSNAAPPIWVAIRHAWLEPSPSPAHGHFSFYPGVMLARQRNSSKIAEHLRWQQALVVMSALLARAPKAATPWAASNSSLVSKPKPIWKARATAPGIEHVQAGLRTLSSTVNNVLHLHNTPQPELAPTDLGQLLDWAYDFLSPARRAGGVEMQLINSLRGVVIPADRHRLEQVLPTLALNAFRFMPGGGWLSFGEATVGDNTEIVVRDTGPGIAADDPPRIFDVGFSTRAGSSGLGLAVCHRILEQHGARSRLRAGPVMAPPSGSGFPRSQATAADGTASSSFNRPRVRLSFPPNLPPAPERGDEAAPHR